MTNQFTGKREALKIVVFAEPVSDPQIEWRNRSNRKPVLIRLRQSEWALMGYSYYSKRTSVAVCETYSRGETPDLFITRVLPIFLLEVFACRAALCQSRTEHITAAVTVMQLAESVYEMWWLSATWTRKAHWLEQAMFIIGFTC